MRQTGARPKALHPLAYSLLMTLPGRHPLWRVQGRSPRSHASREESQEASRFPPSASETRLLGHSHDP